MRRILIALALSLPAVATFADEQPDPVRDAITDLGDARPEIYLRSIDKMIATSDSAKILSIGHVQADQLTADYDDSRCRYEGAAYCIDVARRYAATEIGSVSRWMILEELMTSVWKGHATATLLRAGLKSRDAARVLIERAQAELTCQECIDRALSDVNFEDHTFAEAERKGNSLVPHALRILAVSPWIANEGWPPGPTAMKQRRAVKVVSKAKATAAIPYLLQHVDAPSAMLQFDVLRALTELTADAAWAKSDVSNADALSAQRAAWWTREGKAHGDAARWFALDSLKLAADFQFSHDRHPMLDSDTTTGKTNPLKHLFQTIELMTGRKAPKEDDTPWVRTWDAVEAVRYFQGMEK